MESAERVGPPRSSALSLRLSLPTLSQSEYRLIPFRRLRYVVIPKSVDSARIQSNADIYDFELDRSDMDALDGLDQGAAGAVTWNPVDKD